MLNDDSIAYWHCRAEWRPPADVPPAPVPEEVPGEEPGEIPPGEPEEMPPESDPVPHPAPPEARVMRRTPGNKSH